MRRYSSEGQSVSYDKYEPRWESSSDLVPFVAFDVPAVWSTHGWNGARRSSSFALLANFYLQSGGFDCSLPLGLALHVQKSAAKEGYKLCDKT